MTAITISDIKLSIAGLKMGKRGGADGLVNEMLRGCPMKSTADVNCRSAPLDYGQKGTE